MSTHPRGAPVKWRDGDDRDRCGVVTEPGAESTRVLVFDMAARRVVGTLVSTAALSRLPLTTCVACGVNLGESTADEDRAAEELTKTMFAALPPPERRTTMCERCVPILLEMDRGIPSCTCAASRGGSLRCVCEWRRAQRK